MRELRDSPWQTLRIPAAFTLWLILQHFFMRFILARQLHALKVYFCMVVSKA